MSVVDYIEATDMFSVYDTARISIVILGSSIKVCPLTTITIFYQQHYDGLLLQTNKQTNKTSANKIQVVQNRLKARVPLVQGTYYKYV